MTANMSNKQLQEWIRQQGEATMGRKRKGERLLNPSKELCDCGNEKSKGAKVCMMCAEEKSRSSDPSPEEIAAMCSVIREGWTDTMEETRQTGPGRVEADTQVVGQGAVKGRLPFNNVLKRDNYD